MTWTMLRPSKVCLKVQYCHMYIYILFNIYIDRYVIFNDLCIYIYMYMFIYI
jgi:hypothetical protein